MIKPEEKKMIVLIDRSLHIAIKTHAAGRGRSIKSWVIEAVVEKMEKENKLGEYAAGAKL